MGWRCERCGMTDENSLSIKIQGKDDRDLLRHSVSADMNLCLECAIYLLWSRVFPNGIRIYWDEYYRSANINLHKRLGRKSRYGSFCRRFDIKYGFLDEKTNTYWDE